MSEREITQEQMLVLLGSIRELNALSASTDFFNHAARAVRPLLSHTHLAVEAYDLGDRRLLGGAIPTLDATGHRLFQDAFLPNLDQHPGWNMFRNMRFRMEMGWTHACVASEEFEKTPIYNEWFKPIGADEQVWFGVQLGGECVLTCAYSRDGGFSDREQRLMWHLMPHFAQAWRSWNALRESSGEGQWLVRGLERLNVGLIELAPDGRVRRVSGPAERLLDQAFAGGKRCAGLMPPPVQAWVRRSIAAERERALPPGPLRVRGAAGELHLRLQNAGLAQEPGWLVLVEQHQAPPDADVLAERFGLTTRRARVLALLCEGCTNIQIGARLGISPRTVSKHLESIYRTLRVSTRTAAVAAVSGKVA